MTGVPVEPVIEATAPARRWNKGVWIRFALAISPTVIFAILGYRASH